MRRRYVILVALAALVTVVSLALAQQSTGMATNFTNLRVLRAEGDEDAALIALTTAGDFASIPADAIEMDRSSARQMRGGALGTMACAGAAADKTFTVVYYGWRYENGPCQRLMSVAYTTGTQAVVKYPQTAAAATDKFWADTAVVTCYRGSGVLVNDGDGGNGATEIGLDLQGCYWVAARVSGADGLTGVEAGDVTVYYFLW